MHKIIDSTHAPELLPLFRKWVESEWDTVDPFENPDPEQTMPAPILVVDREQLLGGLSFTCFSRPGSKEPAVWINTVYVAPEFRKRGIASELIVAAESVASDLGITEIFVFTDIPALYEKHGWSYVDTAEGSTILKKELQSDAWELRELLSGDFDEWSRMRTLLWPDTDDAHRSEIEAYFAETSHNPSQVYVIENPDGGLCGFIELSIRNYAEGSSEPEVPFVEGWYVDSACQGLGLGRKLIAAAESWAREQGYNELGSDADLDNQRSIAAHARLGFQETGRCVCFLKPLE